MNNDDFFSRLKTYLEFAETAPVPFRTLKISALAPGIVAIYDTTDEWEAYFDRLRWEPREPEFWIVPRIYGDMEVQESTLYPPHLEGRYLGVLPGKCQVPFPQDAGQMLQMAKRHLKPLDDSLTWFEYPVPLS